MTHDRKNKSLGKIFIFFICFLFAIIVRIGLLTVNLWSNDNHIDVAKFIINDIFPVQEDCWQCYHSHLYHWIIAFIFKIFHVVDLIPQVQLSQSLNSIFGLANMFLILRYVFNSSLPSHLSLSLGMLVAVFPALVSSDIQATNDSLAILIATLSLWVFIEWIRKGNLVNWAVLVILLALAPIAKGTNLAFVFAILFYVILRLIKCWRIKVEIRKTLFLLLGICIVSLPISFFKGNYYPHYVKYNNPFITNQFPPWRKTEIPQRPNYLENTTTEYEGLRSIFDGYFKFRFVDMMVYPYLTRNYELTQEHRTSFWSRLYGSLNSISFDGWPPAWSIHSELIYSLRRVIFIFALLPLGLLFLGILKSLKSCGELLRYSCLEPENEEDALSLCIFLFSLLFAAYNFYLWRSFDMAKGLYILSSILPLVGLVVRGTKIISVICKESILNTISFLFIFLALCYILDLSFLFIYLRTANDRIPN